MREDDGAAGEAAESEIRPVRLQALVPGDMDGLVTESVTEGFGHIRRLVEDYASGRNRFDLAGEALFGIYAQEDLVAVGGLNRNPSTLECAIGRVRRVYVSPAFRRRGIGRRLMEAIIAAARPHFHTLVLRTDRPESAAFYEALGFTASALTPNTTHHLVLEPERIWIPGGRD